MVTLVDLDLSKYGLSHLLQKRPIDMSDTEIDQVLDVFAQEDIAPPVFDAGSNPSLWHELLAQSKCRGCGDCCSRSHPMNHAFKGIEVLEDELKLIAKKYHISHRAIQERSKKGNGIKNPDPPFQSYRTRRLTLPCLFQEHPKSRCQVYVHRPMVCRIFPLVFNGDAISLKVDCAYGKDLYRVIINRLKQHRSGQFLR